MDEVAHTYYTLDILSLGLVVSSILAVIATFWMLIVRPEILHPVKRIGLALTAAGLLMAIGPTLDTTSPFAQWSNILARVGVFILAVGYALDHHLIPKLGKLNQWNALINASERVRELQKELNKDDRH